MKKVWYPQLMLFLTIFCMNANAIQTIHHVKSIGKDAQQEYCHASDEFVAAMKYLNDSKYLSLDSKKVVNISHEVSKGCTDSAKSFIQISDLLLKAGIDSSSALKTALKFSKEDRSLVISFIEIFKLSFLEKNLDLSLNETLKISLDLTLNVTDRDNQKEIFTDYQKIATKCIESDGLDLPKPKCAQMAINIASLRKGKNYSVADDFFELIEFLQDKKLANMPLYKAINISEKVLKNGIGAKVNFMKAYKFASKEKIVGPSVNNIINFSLLLAQRSFKNLD